MSSRPVLALIAIGAALAIAASAIAWARARRSSPWGMSLVVAVAPLSLYAVLAVATVKATHDEIGYWSTARLLPSVALTKGHDVYTIPTEGAVQTTMYPPIWVVSYLPVAAGSTPSQVLQIGLVLALLFSFIPVALLFVDLAPTIGLGVLGACSFVLASMWIDSLAGSLFLPHADAPGLGYAMAACWLTLRSGPLTRRRIISIALLVWFSLLSKQVMAPILVALPLWLLLIHGWKQCLRLVGWLTVTGAAVAALLVPFFRPEGVLFNCMTIPARIPWREDHPPVLMLLRVFAELVIHTLPLVLFVAAIAVLTIAFRSRCPTGSAGWRVLLERNSWMLLVGVALCMVPVSVLGGVKIGGAINSFSPTTYFLLSASLLGTLSLVGHWKERPEVYQAALGAAAFCTAILAGSGTLRAVLDMDTSLREHQSQEAYDFLLEEDPRAFFPLHPLAHLLADGTLYHFGASLYDREVLARLPLAATQRDNHLPADPSIVCWDQHYWGEPWLKESYFRDYAQPIESSSLGPRWKCYQRSNDLPERVE